MNNLSIGDQVFSHIKTRLYTPVNIYGNSHSFVRVGPAEVIKHELDAHKRLLEFGFQVAEILDFGEIPEGFYYREESLGERILGWVFYDDWKSHGVISDEHFEQFMSVTQNYARAQIGTVGKWDEEVPSFCEGINIDELFTERPVLQVMAQKAIEQAQSRLSVFPAVFSQGDFNPHNLFAKGVIDFDAGFMAPYGYDLTTAILHTYAFAPGAITEYPRAYTFTPEQEDAYFMAVDEISVAAGYPKVSEFTEDFLIGRLIWSAVRMDAAPKLQAWRYKRLERIFEMYLNDEAFVELYKR